MLSLTGKTVDENLVGILNLVHLYGEKYTSRESSRNGPVLTVSDGTDPCVALTLRQVRHSFTWLEIRQANPFLTFFDGLSMFSDNEKTDFLATYAKSYHRYGDNGILAGAYGNRLLVPVNQYLNTATELLTNQKSRRVALSMWRPTDTGSPAADVPCNLIMTPRILNGSLCLTVFNRSNDILWGMCGTNPTQFSFVLLLLAKLIGVPAGTLTQISTNAHVYLNSGPYQRMLENVKERFTVDPVARAAGSIAPEPLFADLSIANVLDFFGEVNRFVEDVINDREHKEPKFIMTTIASRLHKSFMTKKQTTMNGYWHEACDLWLYRREPL